MTDAPNLESFIPPSDYIWIRAWGERMGSFEYYIVGQQNRASQQGAPVTAIYGRDGDWHTLATITGGYARYGMEAWAIAHGHTIPDEVMAVWESTPANGEWHRPTKS